MGPKNVMQGTQVRSRGGFSLPPGGSIYLSGARVDAIRPGARSFLPALSSITRCCCPLRWKSDSLTVIETPPGIDSNMIVKHAYAKYDLSIGIGLSQVNGKVCVITSMGDYHKI